MLIEVKAERFDYARLPYEGGAKSQFGSDRSGRSRPREAAWIDAGRGPAPVSTREELVLLRHENRPPRMERTLREP